MSVDAVVSRIAQLQSLMAPPQAAPTANFAATLASASAPTATAAAATATTPTATLASTGATGPSTLPAGTPYVEQIWAILRDPRQQSDAVRRTAGGRRRRLGAHVIR